MAYTPRRKKIFYSDIFTSESAAYYRTHIIEFVIDIIFQDNPDYFLSDQQKELLIAIQNNKRVSAKSGKGIGKTGGLSFAIIWFICCHSNPKIICTAPTFPTLKSALWPEVALWLNISLVKDIFEHTSERLYLIEAPKNWFAEPRTARQKEDMQGIHADNLLILADEASGLKDDIHEALDTTLTGKNNKYVMIGNPTQTVGPFHDSFNKHKKKWFNLTFNAEQSPFVKQEQIDYYAEKYGKHHDLYQVNVCGNFPTGSADAFIKLSDCHAAVVRYDYVDPRGDIEIGLDVARFGDDLTVLYWRYGYKVYPAKTLAKSSIVDCANLVYETVDEIRKSTGYDRKIRVKVDDSGVGGGCVDLLKEDRKHNIEVVPCNFGGAGNDQYQNEASIMWSRIKDSINIMGLPDDTHLIEELSSRRWRISPSGKIMIEPKSEYKKEFKSSPDRADALVLCFADKVVANTVLNHFDVLDPTVIKTLAYAGEDKFCSIFYSKDLLVSVIYASWDGSRVYIFDEHVGEDSIISISTNILQHGGLSRIIGNEKMFNKNGNGIDSKYRKFGINVHENFNYDELSSIETIINLTAQKRLVVNPGCKKVVDQLSSWRFDSKKLSQEKDFGLCYSLSQIMFYLKRKINTGNKPLIVNNNYLNKSSNNIDINNYNNIDSWMLM